jgi:uncharacterized protein (DUF2252 family)
MPSLDPMALAKRQIANDRARTRRFPHIFPRKGARMRASPLAFLRGAAPLFYELLREDPTLAAGPAGEGWLAGDLHIENFGAFVAQAGGRQHSSTVFDLNDFDDCMIGPVRLDLLRLSTSLILAARELGANGGQALHMVDELIDAWCHHVCRPARLPGTPPPVLELIEQVRTRTRVDLLDARSRVKGGRRAFVRGPRYADLPRPIAKALPAAFEGYLQSLPENRRPSPTQARMVDAAFRIAGTGSLGVLRVAVLVHGKGDPNGNWIFDLKQQGTPAGARFGRVPHGLPAQRLLEGMRACLVAQPRLIGTTQLLGVSMLGRRLSPQEDKLDLTRINSVDLPPLARYLGALLGNAHRRGGARVARRAWPDAARRALVSRAIRLAGIHEAAYLAYCVLTD